MGVVHHASFLVWLEIGRTDWLRTAGLSYRDLEASGLRMPVVAVGTRYHSPAFYDDEILVRTVATELGRLRVRFDYDIVRPADDRLLAQGHTAHVVCGDDNRPRRLPAAVLVRLRGAADARTDAR